VLANRGKALARWRISERRLKLVDAVGLSEVSAETLTRANP